MHLRNRLTRQPKGGPFDKPAGKLAGQAGFAADGGGDYVPMPPHPGPRRYGNSEGKPLDTGLGSGADGVPGGSFSGAANNTGKTYSPGSSPGGGSTSTSQPTSPVYCSGGKLMGDTAKYGIRTPEQKEHRPLTIGKLAYAPGYEPEQWQQEAPRVATRPMTARGTNRVLNQVAPGSQVRNQ